MDPAPALNSLWENKTDSENQEWLGSIWMIPQTPQQAKSSQIWDAPNSYQSFKNDINGGAGSFQMLRPHDIGNNMWNSSPAAAAMSGHKLANVGKESVNSLWAAPTPTSYNNYKVNSNPNAAPPPQSGPSKVNMRMNMPNNFAGNPAASTAASFAAPQLMPVQAQQPQQQQLPLRPAGTPANLNNKIINSNNHDTNGIMNHHNQLQAQNACLQLFSDDFLNYFNNMFN